MVGFGGLGETAGGAGFTGPFTGAAAGFAGDCAEIPAVNANAKQSNDLITHDYGLQTREIVKDVRSDALSMALDCHE
jgi:hypothetical protein